MTSSRISSGAITRKCSIGEHYPRTIESVATWKDVDRIAGQLPETTPRWATTLPTVTFSAHGFPTKGSSWR
jgi:hypothetical protein